MTKKSKKKELTEVQSEFLRQYARNAGDMQKIAVSMGVSVSRCRALAEVPEVKERLSRSVARAREMLEASAPHLAEIALNLINDENVSPKIRASLLDSLLDRAGVAQPKTPLIEINLNTEIQDRARRILAEKVDRERVLTIEATATAPTEQERERNKEKE